MEKYQNKTSKKVATIEQTIELPKGKLFTLKHEDGTLEQITEANFKKRWVLTGKKITKQKAIEAVNKAVDKVAKDMRVKTPKKDEKPKKETGKAKTTKKDVKQSTQKGSKKVSRRKKKLEKITYEELVKKFKDFNEKHNYDIDYVLEGVVVVDPKHCKNELSVEQRSYRIASDSPAFLDLGKQIYADNLEDENENIRLDYFLDKMTFEYCYVLGEVHYGAE